MLRCKNGHGGVGARPPEDAGVTVEELAQQAIDLGYISTPKSPRELEVDGRGRVGSVP